MKDITLIDELLDRREFISSSQVFINGQWFIAKPLPYYGWHNALLRLRAAWAVLTGRAMAVQFMEDRVK